MPPDLPPQWTVVNSWDVPIDHPGNVIVVSVPSILDPSLAPEARRAGGGARTHEEHREEQSGAREVGCSHDGPVITGGGRATT